MIALTLYQQDGTGHAYRGSLAVSGGSGKGAASQPANTARPHRTASPASARPRPGTAAPVTSASSQPPAYPGSSPTLVQPPVAASSYVWNGPLSVSVSPSSFENLGNVVNLTVKVRASANTAVEGETVGLDVPETPGNCPALKPQPCDIQFSGGQYGGTDSSGMMTFTISWYPGDACNYSGTGDEFTYPKGTFDYSIDIEDTATGLVSSEVISVTNGPDTPANAPSC